MRRRKKSLLFVFALIVAVVILLVVPWRKKACPSVVKASNGDLILVTGYCNCGECCGWKRNWFGFGSPVYNYGPMKGKPKKVGITATGTTAHHGTIAADPSVFKFGTVLDVPGYGKGKVEDIGGSIKGKHIDIWFPSHDEARRWGRKWLEVRKLPNN